MLAVGIGVMSGCGKREDREAAALPGTLLDRPAPDFTLTDQAGRSISMAALRGRPVVLTFLYTNCPDFCPLTAELLRTAWEQLGPDGARVALVAVSVDPANDSAAAARAFSERHRMPEAQWHYLVGSEDTLTPVWAAYAVGVNRASSGSDQVGHTEALFLIDKQGRQRSLLRGDIKAEQLAGALRRLLKEGS